MTILKEGKDQTELLNLLKEMDELTAMDSLVKNEEHVQIDCVRENGRLKNWKLMSKGSSSKCNTVYATGRTYRRFFKELETINTKTDLFTRTDCYILCYLSAEIAKDYIGNYLTNWVKIEPGLPYSVGPNGPCFQTLQLALSESEHNLMTQTGLAFYDEKEEVLYPITRAAYVSLGRLFDCTMAFRNLDQHLLGSALLLAEKISYSKELRIIHRRKGNRIRPVLSVVGKNYSIFSQHTFFETALSEVAPTLGIFEIEKWSIAEEFTTLSFIYDILWDDYYYRVNVKTGDSANCPFSATLSVQIGHAEIVLLSNTRSHKREFTKEDVQELFSGFFDKMKEFNELYEQIRKYNCHFNPSWLDDIHKTLGQKRSKDLDRIEEGDYHAESLLHEILSTRYMEIPDRQMSELKKNLLDLIYKINNNLINQDTCA